MKKHGRQKHVGCVLIVKLSSSVFNILSRKENASQDDTAIPSHPSQKGNHQKKKKMNNSMGMRNPIYC
jgi:hypothetical protein